MNDSTDQTRRVYTAGEKFVREKLSFRPCFAESASRPFWVADFGEGDDRVSILFRHDAEKWAWTVSEDGIGKHATLLSAHIGGEVGKFLLAREKSQKEVPE